MVINRVFDILIKRHSLVSVLFRIELVEQILVNGLRLRGVQHVKRDPVLRGVAVKQVGFHPGGVLNRNGR